MINMKNENGCKGFMKTVNCHLAKKLLSIGRGYRIKYLLGTGRFGTVYAATRERSKLGKVAVKLGKSVTSKLDLENVAYNEMGSSKYIPDLYQFVKSGKVHIMIFELLGPNLNDIFIHNNRVFSRQTVLLIAIQTLKAIEFVHRKKYLHRDIKPHNFVIRVDKSGLVSIVICDFGFSKKWYDPKTKRHIPVDRPESIFGTPRYMSISSHSGNSSSRKDDLEALGYMYSYFLNGNLPWQGLKCKTPSLLNDQILAEKKKVDIKELYGKENEVFSKFLKEIKKLKYDENPCYWEWIGKFTKEYKVYEPKKYVFDWDLNFDKYKKYIEEKS